MGLEFDCVARWRPRKDGIHECTDRLYRYLHAIGEISPHLATWYDKAYSREEALQKRISLDHKSLRKIVDDGKHRRDSDGSVIRDLGFSIGIWNGDVDDHAVGLRGCCGLYWDGHMLNTISLISLSEDWPAGWLNVSTAVALVHAAVTA